MTIFYCKWEEVWSAYRFRPAKIKHILILEVFDLLPSILYSQSGLRPFLLSMRMLPTCQPKLTTEQSAKLKTKQGTANTKSICSRFYNLYVYTHEKTKNKQFSNFYLLLLLQISCMQRMWWHWKNESWNIKQWNRG